MGHPGYVAVQPPKPPVSAADVAVSVTTLVLTGLMIAGGAVIGLFSLAFLDHCPPETCSPQGAVNAVATALFVAVAVGVLGLTATVVQLVRRRRGWPFAVATLALCVVAFFFGGLAYSAAVS